MDKAWKNQRQGRPKQNTDLVLPLTVWVFSSLAYTFLQFCLVSVAQLFHDWEDMDFVVYWCFTVQNRSNTETWHFSVPSYSSWCQPRWALYWKPKQLGGVLKVRESTNDIASSQSESYLDFPWSFKWYLIKHQTKLPAVVTSLYCGTSSYTRVGWAVFVWVWSSVKLYLYLSHSYLSSVAS